MFHYADQAGLPLLDLKDLRSVISYLVSADGKADLTSLGGLSGATAGVILRDLIALSDNGGRRVSSASPNGTPVTCSARPRTGAASSPASS